MTHAQHRVADPFSREALEFPAVVELLGRFLSGPLSKPALAAIEPHTDLAQILPSLAAAREARDYLLGNPRPSLAGLADPRPQLETLRVQGASCSPLEILAVVEMARAACNCRDPFRNTPFTTLAALARKIPDLRNLVKDIGGKILPDGSLDSSASPALARIRRSLERTQQELQSRLERILHRLGQDQMLQDDVITLRNGRFVLPVKTEKKRQVEGVVHGASSSGQSVFVEPLETLPINNELVELQDQEVAEVQRVLGEFSEKLRDRREDLVDSVQRLSELDLAFAKAEFARQYGACFPEFSTTRDLALSEARHPLLIEALRASASQPVPLTVTLSEPQSLMIISGPNTGGKTVALKTVGIAALMAQAGLPVTADAARLPLFNRVLADIGDQQSIEQNLSTFSAHVRNIQAMVEVADGGALALLDEIGGSTDPHEGAALAVAILEYFRRRRSLVFVSTHHSRLKAYAASTPEAVNAAMDFDESTLQPTYRFLPGLPGKSSGLDIAERLGLDGGIVKQARALIGPAETETAALIASLHAKRDELEAAMEGARRERQELEAREARLKQEMAGERQAKLRELDKRLENTLHEYSGKWERAIGEIRKQMQSEAKSTKALGGAARKGDAMARGAREEWNAQVLEAIDQPQAAAGPDVPAAVGDRVRLPDLATPGVVTALIGEDQIEVELGRLRMRVPRDGARVLERPHQPDRTGTMAPTERHYEAPLPGSGPDAPGEINVIGATAEEAREQVDKFLDSAFVAGRPRLRIIHGFGKGILRKTLQEMFASHPHVDKFYPAAKQEGGEGATIVELKK
ncbi:MAG: endonuclease MutS2 [Terriglobia bacterium]